MAQGGDIAKIDIQQYQDAWQYINDGLMRFYLWDEIMNAQSLDDLNDVMDGIFTAAEFTSDQKKAFRENVVNNPSTVLGYVTGKNLSPTQCARTRHFCSGKKYADELGKKFPGSAEKFVNGILSTGKKKYVTQLPLGELLSLPTEQSIYAQLPGLLPGKAAKVITALKADPRSTYKVCDRSVLENFCLCAF